MPDTDIPKSKFIRREELDKVLTLVRRDKTHGQRNFALIFAAASMGLRVTEAVYLKFHNFRELAKGFVYVPTAKKRRKIKLAPSVVERRKKSGHKHPGWDLEGYAAEDRPEIKIAVAPEVVKVMTSYLNSFKNYEGWVFPSQKGGKHITERQAFAIFSQACKKAGLGHKSFHALRHYRGFHVQSLGKDIDWTRRQLRHESIETTKIYTRRTPDEEKKLAEKLSW